MAAIAEQRRFFRVATRLVPSYVARVDEHLTELKRFDAVISDLSGGGMLLRTRQWVPTLSRVRVQFTLGEDDPIGVDAQANVLVVRQTGHVQIYRVHCSFIDLERRDAERIVRYVYRQQLALRRRGVA